ncbi:MAG: DUF58 domain-containing protein [Actinobacteria bacterium]|nr:DUF58 domain-containing protein [Actinomycetota bacterium]
MPSTRGLVVVGAGLFLWLGARLVGSPDLHIVAVGVVLLPVAAALFARWNRQRLTMVRRLSSARAALGQRITVELEVQNRSGAPTSFLLLEDRLPASLGRSARMVLTGLPGRGSQRVGYSIVCRARGRYHLGPATLDISDPFALSRVRMEFPHRDELVVYPEVEPLRAIVAAPYGSGSGDSTTRHLFRTGEEFYTMREYQMGDDLRRIHWPSVARRGRLMIRQDESARRSTATIFLDTRVSTFGQTGMPAFEKAVSVAASVGSFLSASGFALRLATPQAAPAPVTVDTLLENLAGAAHTPTRALGQALLPLRSGSLSGSTLVVVSAPPPPAEIAALTRSGTAFAGRIAILIHPTDPATLPPEPAAQLEQAASTARLSLARAGWEVFVLPPQGRLQDVWRVNRTKLLVSSAPSR